MNFFLIFSSKSESKFSKVLLKRFKNCLYEIDMFVYLNFEFGFICKSSL